MGPEGGASKREGVWLAGPVTAGVVATVILGGITRIVTVNSVLAPLIGAIYAAGAFLIIVRFYGPFFPALSNIFREAFKPTSGVAGTGAGVFVLTMMRGVRRGRFANEAGQGSAPIGDGAAKTGEPVSEGWWRSSSLTAPPSSSSR